MEETEGKLINIRKLVALDIHLHGPRFILIEFGVGTPAIILTGLWLMLSNTVLSSLSFLIGIYILLTGINYLPLLGYAITLSKNNSYEKEVAYGLSNDKHYVRKYSTQQLLIFLPLAIIILAIIQKLKKAN